MAEDETYDADFLALGLGATNMMSMIWSVAMGKRCVGVEIRGDPFLSIHWNVREDFYHQLGLVDDLMMKRFGKQRLVPKRANGKIFKLAECFYTPKTEAGYVVADEVIDGHDKVHHIAGTIKHVEFIDDRCKDGKPNRNVTILPAPKIPKKPDPSKIRTNMRDVLDGPSTFQSEANNILILLRRYLEAVEALDRKLGLEPRVRLFKTHQVKEDGFVKDESGHVSVNIEPVLELDFKGKLMRVPAHNSHTITIKTPELCVIAQGVNSKDAVRLGFEKKDVVVDHKDGLGGVVAQADYIAGFIDVLVHGRIRRRIASVFDEEGQEFWIRSIAVGHENDPQVGWILVQVPDFKVFDPVKEGLVPDGTDHVSVEYFAAFESMLQEYYMQEASKLLEIPVEELKGVRMGYGPKLFSLVERMGADPRIAPNVMVAGDSFGNGHFLTSGGAMTGLIGHAMAVMQFWKSKDESGVDAEEAYKQLANTIKRETTDWLKLSAKEFSSFTPINFGTDRIQKISEDHGIHEHHRAETIDASRRKRHDLQVQDPCDWRRPSMRNGKVYTAGLKLPSSKAPEWNTVTVEKKRLHVPALTKKEPAVGSSSQTSASLTSIGSSSNYSYVDDNKGEKESGCFCW